jgi:hypothetical protein
MTVLKCDPEKELEFPKPGSNIGQPPYSRKLTLTNSSTSEFVAFKVKTTAPKSYLVRPSSGVLQGKGASQEVQIILQPAQAQAGTEQENHRFLVQAVVVNSSEPLDRNAWSEFGKDQIQEQRLNVVFTEGAGTTADTSAAAAPRSTPAVTGSTKDGAGGEDLKAKYDELVQYTTQLEKDKAKFEEELASLTKGGGGGSAAAAGYSRRDIILAALVAFIVAYLTKYL